jgi:hypothetical protein
MKTRVITARLSEDLSCKIEFLKSSLNLTNTTSVVTQAIHLLYTTTKEKQSAKSSLERFEESDLLGSIEGASDLSTNYKEEISKVVQKKHAQKNTVRSKKSRTKREGSS